MMMMMLAMKNTPWITMKQMQLMAGMLSILVMTLPMSGNNWRLIEKPNLTNFLHLASFAAHFGAQIWITLFAGLIMFLNIPRIWFGQAQSRLFPAFFSSGLVLSSTTLATFLVNHPYENWNNTYNLPVFSLCLCLVSSFINTFILSTVIVRLMVERFHLEKDTGLAYKIGFVNMSALKDNTEYQRVNKLFRRYHSLSGITNTIGLLGKSIYLYYLASHCVFT